MGLGLVLTPWERARRILPFIDVDEEEIYKRLISGSAHLWVSADSAGVTEVSDENYLHIWQCGGTLRGLLSMLPSVEAFAKALGCDGLEVYGRAGWRRVLLKYGFIHHGDSRMVLQWAARLNQPRQPQTKTLLASTIQLSHS